MLLTEPVKEINRAMEWKHTCKRLDTDYKAMEVYFADMMRVKEKQLREEKHRKWMHIARAMKSPANGGCL